MVILVFTSKWTQSIMSAFRILQLKNAKSHSSRKIGFLPTVWNMLFWTRNNYSFPHWFHPFLLHLVRLPLFLRGHVPEQLWLVHLLFQGQHQYFPSTWTTPWKHDFFISKALLTEESMNPAGTQRHLFGPLWWSGESAPGQDALLACSNCGSYKPL